MSWTVEGRRYHNYQEYQRALADLEARRANRAADQLAEENRRLRESIAHDRAAMDKVRDDVRKQIEISNRIQSNVRALERNQERLNSVLRETEQRMEQGFSDLQEELRQQGGRVHGVEVNLDQLRADHRNHVEQVRTQLGAVREELAAGLAEAEAQRRETETRLRESIDAVNRKFEEDRAQRAQQAKSQAEATEGEIGQAAEILRELADRAASLALDGEARAIESQLSAARSLSSAKNESGAFAVASSALAQARVAQQTAHLREAELAAARDLARQRAQTIAAALNPGADTTLAADIEDCYRSECGHIRKTLASIESRLSSRYNNYHLLHIEKVEDDRLLDDMERQVLEITASAPLVAEAAIRRMEQVEEKIDRLRNIFGEPTLFETRFEVPDDPKSDLLIYAEFGSSKLDVRVTLDGKSLGSGYGYPSSKDCSTAFAAVLEVFQESGMVTAHHTEDSARSTPLPRASVASTWNAFQQRTAPMPEAIATLSSAPESIPHQSTTMAKEK